MSLLNFKKHNYKGGRLTLHSVPTGAPGDPGTETTLEHILNMYGELPNKTIADVMDIQSGFLCYDYISP